MLFILPVRTDMARASGPLLNLFNPNVLEATPIK